ncbi:MAG TPA: signal peptidase I [SAR86 cluster bacterium]|nr:signal peptidase I [SAR86 cluster bacterium]
MDTALIILLLSESIGYVLWIIFTNNKQPLKRDITSGVMFLFALIILYKVFKLNLDFGLVLLIATILAALSWLVGKIINIEELRKESRSYFLILLVITSIRAFAYEPYQIPSRSMVPGLQVGDFVLVNKYSYGLKFPGTNYLIGGFSSPERNDVAVFIPPHTLCNSSPVKARPDLASLTTPESQRFLNKFINLQESRCSKTGTKFVKRVVGVPGDTVEIKGYEIWINGLKLVHQVITDNEVETLIQETLDDEIHTIRLLGLLEYAQHKWVIPDGHYLAIGDNRDNSLDSRAWGYFSEDYLIGKAEFIWLHWGSFSELPTLSRNKRIN